MEYHPTVATITTLLTESGVVFETFEHEAVRTSEEAASIRPGYDINQGAKALIVRVKHPIRGKHFIMLVVPGGKRFSTEKLKRSCGFTDVRFATEGEVADVTAGILPGGVPPFGNLFGITVYSDKTLFNNERIVFNAGDKRFSVAMLASDYQKIVTPEVVDIVGDTLP